MLDPDASAPQGEASTGAEASRLWETLVRLLAVPATDLQAALMAATQHIAAVLQADKVDAFLYDPTTDTLVARGTSDTPMGRRQRELGLHRLPVAKGGRTVEVFQTGRPFRDGHAERDPGERADITQGLGIRSTLAAPLSVAEERRGVLLASSAQPEFFSAADLRCLVAIAHWVGMVAQRAELAEQALAYQQTAEVEAIRRTLLAAVSHELLTPLAIIKGHADTLRDPRTRQDAAVAEPALTAIRDEVERLQRLIGNLLDVARASSGGLTLTRAPVDLRRLIDTVVRRFRGRSRRHRFRAQLPHDLPRVLGDRERLDGVLYNLLDNAMKYAPRGGEIVVRAAVRGAFVECAVTDQGRGIAPEHLPRLFEPYYRASSAAQPPGAGLGLYISKVLVEAHGGRIWLDSQVGQGTTVYFTVPWLQPSMAPEGAPAAPE